MASRSTPDSVAPQADVLVVTALKDELRALLAAGEAVGVVWQEHDDPRGYPFHVATFDRTGQGTFTLAAARTNEMGETATAAVAMRLLYHLRPRVLAMCGICAGAEGDVALGDVIVADRLYKFDGGAVRAASGGADDARRVQVFHDLKTYNLRPVWRRYAEDFSDEWTKTLPSRPRTRREQGIWLLEQLTIRPEGEKTHATVDALRGADRTTHCRDWNRVVKQLREEGQISAKGLVITQSGRDALEEELVQSSEGRAVEATSRVHVGAVATSARLQRDPELFQSLRLIVRKTLGVEMEGAAIGAVAELEVVDAIFVKGVVDFANTQKNDDFREYAARAAAAFLVAFLREHMPVTQRRDAVPTKRERGDGASLKDFQWFIVLKASRVDSSRALDDPEVVASELRRVTGQPKIEVERTDADSLVHMVTSNQATFEGFRDEIVANVQRDDPFLKAVQYVARAHGHDADDPCEGKYGRVPRRDGFLLSAGVRRIEEGWYEIHLQISGKSVEGEVVFHLHNTMETPVRVRVRNGRAVLDLEAWGSFTVGAVLNSGRTKLELDLGNVPGVPKGFIDR